MNQKKRNLEKEGKDDSYNKRQRSRISENSDKSESGSIYSRNQMKSKDDSINQHQRSRISENNGKSESGSIYSRNQTKTDRVVWGHVAKEEEMDAKLKKNVEVPEDEKHKANFGLSGALAKDEITGNVYNGIVLKWTEPLDAARPTRRWRLYVFKDDQVVETLLLHRQSAYLAGREKKVADILLAHPSCSSQHAVIQYRFKVADDGKREVLPYILDLNSTNKTYLNGLAIEDSRYIELREKDVLKFGMSTREYVLLHEDVKY